MCKEQSHGVVVCLIQSLGMGLTHMIGFQLQHGDISDKLLQLMVQGRCRPVATYCLHLFAEGVQETVLSHSLHNLLTGREHI